MLELIHRVFGLPLVGAFKLLHVMLFLTGMALLSASAPACQLRTVPRHLSALLPGNLSTYATPAHPLASHPKQLVVQPMFMFQNCSAGLRCAGALRVLHNLREMEVSAVFPTANAELTHLSKRWRAERNSWIAAFAFTMWL